MIILGIETSCDDTGIAIIQAPDKKQGSFKILSNIISSQIKIHQKYGGVVPNLAAREHLKNIEPCLREAFKRAKAKPKEIDLIAVTIGPGLIPSLLIGVNFAKALAYKWQKPIVGINHIEAHIAAALVGNSIQYTINRFPAIALVVSGGHTQLILVNPVRNQRSSNGVKKIGDYKIIGETRDDAAGECFDKVAKLLGLEYPGGPEIAAMATKSKIRSIKSETNSKYQIRNTKYEIRLPRPMIGHKNYDFSFSGLKTAVLYLLRDTKNINIPTLCKEVQQAIIDVLIEKTLRAAKEYKAKTIILSGGVAANEELRNQLKVKCKLLNVNFLVPSKNLCTDNAAMIAIAGYFNKEKATKKYNKIKANANLRIG